MNFLTKLAGAVAVATLLACSSSSTTPTTAGSDAGTEGGVSVVAQGMALVAKNACTSCHGTDLAGTPKGIPGVPTVHGLNLTPDKETGTGEWTDEQLKKAIRTGIDDEGEELCSNMPRFATLTDAEVSAIVAYLRSVPAVKQEIPDSICDEDVDAGADAAKDASSDAATGG